MRLVEKYGAYSVLGRPLHAREILRIDAAQKIYLAKITRDKSEDWVKWSQDNKQAAALLAKAERLVNG